jgi:hypothetical protein
MTKVNMDFNLEDALGILPTFRAPPSYLDVAKHVHSVYINKHNLVISDLEKEINSLKEEIKYLKQKYEGV